MTVTGTRTGSDVDSHRDGGRRSNPRRTTRLFHGTSSTSATAATPCATTTQRPRGDPVATAPAPVANASTSAANSARLVRRPDGVHLMAPPAGSPPPPRQRRWGNGSAASGRGADGEDRRPTVL